MADFNVSVSISINEGTYDATVSGNMTTFCVNGIRYTAIGTNYVKGINVKDTITVYPCWIESKVLGPVYIKSFSSS